MARERNPKEFEKQIVQEFLGIVSHHSLSTGETIDICKAMLKHFPAQKQQVLLQTLAIILNMENQPKVGKLLQVFSKKE